MKVNWSDNFEAEYNQKKHKKYAIRLLALWKIQSGFTETEVCSLLKLTHKTIHRWRRLYEAEGIEALMKIRPGRGRKPRLVSEISLKEDIHALQAQRAGGRVRAQDIVNWVAEKYQVTYSLSGMYHVLHRLGFSWITARSKHPKQDEEKQEAFKKTF